MKTLQKMTKFGFAKKSTVQPSGQIVNIFKDRKDPVGLKGDQKGRGVSSLAISADGSEAGL